MAPNYRFSRWDGTQLLSEAADEALLNEFMEDVLARGDIDSSLRSILRRGAHPRDSDVDVQGMDDMLRKLRAQRQEVLRKHDLGSLLDDLRNKLEEVIQTERQGIEERVAAANDAVSNPPEGLDAETAARLSERVRDMAQRNEAKLNALPDNLGDAVRELNDYEFMEPEAQRLFEELKSLIQQQFVDRQFSDLKDGLDNLTQQDVDAAAEMMRELNSMLQRHMRGDEDPGFDEFMEQWGGAFGDSPPQDIGQLIDRLQEQAAQAQSLMSSLSPSQRQQLQDMISGMLDNPQLAQQMSELQANLDNLRVGGELGRKFKFSGDEPLALKDALNLMDELNRMDGLEDDLKKALYGGGGIDQIDAEQLGEILGEDAEASLERLRQLAERAVEEGLLTHDGEGRP